MLYEAGERGWKGTARDAKGDGVQCEAEDILLLWRSGGPKKTRPRELEGRGRWGKSDGPLGNGLT